MSAPIALFVYKRLEKTKQCLSALEQNKLADDTELYIFSDGAKNKDDLDAVQGVRDYIESYKNNSGFQSVNIVYAEKNKGLANSIISGVTSVIKKYNKIIVLEDDIIVASDFLTYMNGALDFYEEDKRYGSVSAYTNPMKELDQYDKDIFVMGKGECWGWGTWKDRWENVDWTVADYESYRKNRRMRFGFEALESGLDEMLYAQKNGYIDSWAVRWCFYLYKNKLWTVYPRISRTINIGFDGDGTHCEKISEEKFPKKFALESSEKSGCDYEKLEVNKFLERINAKYSSKWKIRLKRKLKILLLR